ncbi:MAG TPA: hypothetical protein VNO17_09775 [Actinomycetota bacterium]|nr:hypothetical protein [Actinomycetota bacterium]
MRRLVALAAVAALAAACSPRGAVPLTPNAIEQMAPTLGLDVTSARRTGIDFVRAYAEAGDDAAARLRTFAGTRKLVRWAEWVGVQVEQFRGDIVGRVDVDHVSFLGFVRLGEAGGGPFGAQLDLDASVVLTFDPARGETVQRARLFHGPMTLFRRGLADWGVVDVFRDGVSMDGAIHLIDEPASSDGLTVELDSVFAFVPEWSVNLVITNRTGSPVSLFPPEAAIVGPGGSRVEGQGGTANLRRVPDGVRRMRAIVTFPAVPDVEGATLLLPFRLPRGRGRIDFAFPLGELLSLAEPPAASPPPAPG